ncbi:MAG TPA: hypothetical protein VJX67_16765, partial [Blastocatellia bacterium]|nr:hypothetical protein [Blastocatellia bacterium]
EQHRAPEYVKLGWKGSLRIGPNPSGFNVNVRRVCWNPIQSMREKQPANPGGDRVVSWFRVRF